MSKWLTKRKWFLITCVVLCVIILGDLVFPKNAFGFSGVAAGIISLLTIVGNYKNTEKENDDAKNG